MQEARDDGNINREMEKAVEAFEASLETYLPVLMSQAKILWEKGEYEQVLCLFTFFGNKYSYAVFSGSVGEGVPRVGWVLPQKRHVDAQSGAHAFHAGDVRWN